MKRQTKIVAVGGAAGVAVVALVASLTLGASLTSGAGPSDAKSPAPPTSASSGDPTPTPAPASSEGAPGDADAPPTPVVDPYYGDIVVAPSAGGTAAFASGLAVELVSVTGTTISGSGIGSTSGPGIEVTVRVTNTSASTVGLTPVVNAYSGQERVPLTPDHDSALAASLAGSAESVGSYTFAVGDADSTIWITVSTAPDSGLVLFEYDR